ncbi:MAG: PDZ domain-containing protein, partial [bacterium]
SRVVLRAHGAIRELTLDIPAERPGEDGHAESVPQTGRAIFGPLLGQARIVPRFGHDGTVGIEVSAIQAGSQLEQIGLEDGDVITAFNGVPIDSQAGIAKVLHEMADADVYQLAGHRTDGSEHVWSFIDSRGRS